MDLHTDFQGGCWVHGLVGEVSVVTQIPVDHALRREEKKSWQESSMPYRVVLGLWEPHGHHLELA